jgi:pSer/pThr/pTyr-binding forkhead associated (FHA) protein
LIVQLSILSGKRAGATWVARRFPVRIGRAPSTDLQFEEEGVWNEHLTLDFNPTEGFLLQAHPQAIVSINGQPVERSLLHNGDILELGALRLQFWLAETPQRGLRLREALTWAAIVTVSLSQIALIYWLLKT